MADGGGFAGAASQPIATTFFRDHAAAEQELRVVTLDALAQRIADATAPTKAELPLLKLARFGNVRTAKGCLRHDRNIIAVTGIEVDYDGELIGFDEAVERAEKTGLLAIAYTSPSHTPERPRWRLVCPTSSELAPDQRAQMVDRANGMLGGCIAAESWTVSQAYYFGSVAGKPTPRVVVVEGETIDQLDELDLIAIGKPGTKSNGAAGNHSQGDGAVDEDALLEAIRTGDSYHASAMRLLGYWESQGVTLAEARARLEAAFEAVPESGRDQRWRDRVADIPNQLAYIWAKEGAKRDSATPEVARLAKLSPLDYDREREAAAAKLGCRVATLDGLVRKERLRLGLDEDAPNGQGRTLTLPEPKPWHEPVEGEQLIDDVTKAILQYVILEEDLAYTTALWVIASHAFNEFAIFPRLFISAPEKNCGKSTLLDVIFRLVNRPLIASHITAAAIFRTIEKVHPTLLLDEADAYIRGGHEDLRAVIDAGHRREGNDVIRTVGDDHEPRGFSCWAPMAIAAIGHLPGTIEDRSIVIPLRRRLPDEAVESLRYGRTGLLDDMARKIARWVVDNKGALGASDPPTELINRLADNWRPLLAVAQVAGGSCPSTADRISAALARGQDGADSVGVMLLRELRTLFTAKAVDVLFVKEIVEALVSSDEGPWSEWRNGAPINGRGIAKLVGKFGVPTNKTVRRGSDTDKGYRSEWFEDAFARYLRPAGGGHREPMSDEELDEWLNMEHEG